MSETSKQAVQTTGHAWDGDLQEYNNPLPKWWVWTFYATCVFALVYWVLYPAWPVGKGFTTGLKEITYKTSSGKEVTTHWNTRAMLAEDIQTGEEGVKQREYLEKITSSSYEEILSDPDKMAFVRSMGKVSFADNCAACHGTGGNGVVGLFPNLVDDAWLWGGDINDIYNTISHGHHGYMPSFAETFDDKQASDVAAYVLSLSGIEGDEASIKRGDVIFNGQEGGCYYCHTHQGSGRKSVGSANLTDKIWTIANVPGAESYEGKQAAIKAVIMHGVSRQMPAWHDRLPDSTIKLLTVYVYSLGGGE
jgi:cytochrome c oxidase cbb3-type subunit III